MAYNPRQPRNKDGEWTSGGGSGASAEGQHGPVVKYDISKSALVKPGRFAFLTKDTLPAPLPGETYGERNLRLAYEATSRGVAPPTVVGRDARRTFVAGMAKALNDSPRSFVPKGGKAFKKPKGALAPGAYTGATDVLRTLPASDPIFEQYRALGIKVPHAPAVGKSHTIKAPALHHTTNGATARHRRSR